MRNDNNTCDINRRLKVTSEGMVIDVTNIVDEANKSIPFPALEQEFMIEAVDSGCRLFQILPAKKGDRLPQEFNGMWSKSKAIAMIKFYRDKLKNSISKPTQFALNDKINPELIKEASVHADNRDFPREGWFLVVDSDGLIHVSKRRGAIAVTDNYLTFNSWSETNEVFKQLGMTLPKDYTKHYKQTHKLSQSDNCSEAG